MEISGLQDATKHGLTERIKHFVKPSYVDLDNQRAIVRFSCKEDAEMFLTRHNMTGCKITTLNETATLGYFEKAQKQRT